MHYPKVRDFLCHVTTGTNVSIKDDIIEDFIYFEGTISKYFDTYLPLENLTLIQSSIDNDTLIVRALKDYDSPYTFHGVID